MGSNSASSLQKHIKLFVLRKTSKHESHGYVQQKYARHKTTSPMKLEGGKYKHPTNHSPKTKKFITLQIVNFRKTSESLINN